MAFPVIPVVTAIGRYMVKNGVKKSIQKYGDDAVKVSMKENNFKTIGDKVVKKRMTAAERKTMSKKIQKEDFPKEKPASKMTKQEQYLEDLEIMSRGGMKDGGPGIEALRKVAPKVVERMGYQEGGSMEDQMMMVMSMPEEPMESDDSMENNYTDFIMEEALTEEEEDMLTSKLEQDEELSMLFDKVIDVAQEFAGSGPVDGPGSGVSDSIPARLSDGEFVFTAKATEEIGADELMRMMKDAEANADKRQQVAVGGMLDSGEEEIDSNVNRQQVTNEGTYIPEEDTTVRDKIRETMLDPSAQSRYVRS